MQTMTHGTFELNGDSRYQNCNEQVGDTSNFTGFKAEYYEDSIDEAMNCFTYQYFENGQLVVDSQFHPDDSEDYFGLSEEEMVAKAIAELESRKEAILALPNITEASPFLQELVFNTYQSENQMWFVEYDDVEETPESQSTNQQYTFCEDLITQQDIDNLEEEIDKFDLYNVIEIGGDAAVTCYASLPNYFNLIKHKESAC